MIGHNKPTLGKEEIAAATRVIESQWVAQGIEVATFEDEFCDFLHIERGHAVAVSSGTAALFMALTILGKKGGPVAYPAYSCAALRNAVALSGWVDCIVDSGISTPNINIEELNVLKPQIAIIPHMYGLPLDITSISKDILVIEDCAQALGSKIGSTFMGIQGTIGVFSFYASKLITSGGQGGMLVSQDRELIRMIQDYREFDQRADEKKRFNFQMTDLQAAIGRVQLSRVEKFIQRRKEIFAAYMDAQLPMLEGEGLSNRYRAIMLTDDVESKIEKLQNNGIRAINPLEKWELLSKENSCPIAEKWTKKTISLPIYPDLTDIEVRKIIEGVQSK